MSSITPVNVAPAANCAEVLLIVEKKYSTPALRTLSLSVKF
jgi:hypothetical protein